MEVKPESICSRNRKAKIHNKNKNAKKKLIDVGFKSIRFS
jgi:hypothetical protein